MPTAASIWITAAIGILAGAGFYSAVLIAFVITIGTLTVFRRIESRMPRQIFARQLIVFRRDVHMSESEVRALCEQNGFSVAHVSYRLRPGGEQLEYSMTVRTMHKDNIERLSNAFMGLPAIAEFEITLVED